MIFKTYIFEPFFAKKALKLGKMMKVSFFHTGITEIECFENVFDLQTWQVMQRKSFDKQSRKSGRLSQRTNSVRSLRHWNQKSTWSLQFPLWSRSNAFLKRRNPCNMLTLWPITFITEETFIEKWGKYLWIEWLKSFRFCV